MYRWIVTLLLLVSLACPAADSTGTRRNALGAQPSRVNVGEQWFCSTQLRGEQFLRTELIFGLSRSNGSEITDAEFQSFVDDQITTRFPDGLTVLSANGQFRDRSGTVIQERAKVLVLLYPFDRKNSKLVEEIRAEYKAMFQQQSVLRIDEQMCASF